MIYSKQRNCKNCGGVTFQLCDTTEEWLCVDCGFIVIKRFFEDPVVIDSNWKSFQELKPTTSPRKRKTLDIEIEYMMAISPYLYNFDETKQVLSTLEEYCKLIKYEVSQGHGPSVVATAIVFLVLKHHGIEIPLAVSKYARIFARRAKKPWLLQPKYFETLELVDDSAKEIMYYVEDVLNMRDETYTKSHAATCVWISTLIQGKKVTQSEIGEEFNVSTVSIRNRFRDVANILGFDKAGLKNTTIKNFTSGVRT